MFGRRSKSQEPRHIVFTMHKSGSMLVHRILRDISDYYEVDYHTPNTGGKPLPIDKLFSSGSLGKRNHGFFGPVRFYIPLKELKDANILLHLRDPRDVLTSMFFSYCFMHPGEIEGNTGYRKEAADAGIDKFVLDMTGPEYMSYQGDYGTGGNYKQHIGNIVDRYENYLDHVMSLPNAKLVRYEEMVLDFDNWLKDVLAGFHIEDDELYAKLLQTHGQTVSEKEEDKWSHKRKVTPGDHKDKLKPETIAELNKRFARVMEAVGYSTEAV